MKNGTSAPHRRRFAAGILLTALLALAAAAPVLGQSSEAQPQDVEFEIINATSGEPAQVDRMTIDYVTARRNNLVDFTPSGSPFVAKGVPLKDGGVYIITVWYQDVPYWWSKRGREFVDGPVTLHVFDTVSSLEGISFSGLNLVIRHQESLVRLEYMLQIDNNLNPQVTVYDERATFQLALPDGATAIKATYTRGPDPTEVVVGSPGLKTGLSVPLTPGRNTIRLEMVVPWKDGLEIPVGSDIPVTAWSVLASPEWLEVASTDIEENESEKVSGFRRFVGFPLDAGETIDLRLQSGEKAAGPEEDLFTTDAPADSVAGTGDDAGRKGGGLSLPLIFLGVMIILFIVAAIRRRS